MSDLCLYELEDNVWDEFGETDDHIVPHPGNRQGDQSSVESNSCRKLQSEVIGVSGNADTSVKYSVPGEEKREIQSVTNNTTMLEKDTWSHTTDGVFPSCDTESIKGVPSLASDDARITSHAFKNDNVESDGFCADDSIIGNGGTAGDNNLYSYPLGQMPQNGNDLNFFDSEQGEKDSSDLLYYGWPDIGNFEDVDRMFRSCDSTFGMQSLNNDEELCWFPPSNAAERSEDTLRSGLKISSQNTGFSSKGVSNNSQAVQFDNEGHPIHGSNKKNVFVGTRISSRKTDSNDPSALGQPSFLNEEDTKFESRVILMPTEQINVCKTQPMHQNQLEGEKADQYLENSVSFQHYDNLNQVTDMKHSCGDLSGQVCSTPDIQQLNQSSGPDSRSYVQSRYMQLDCSNHSDQISLCPTPSGSMSENSGFPSPSLKGSSYASNQLQSLESCHGLSIEIPILTMREKADNLQSSQGFLSPSARNFAKLTATSSRAVGGEVLNQKQLHGKNQIEGQNDVEGGNGELPAELVSPNVQESSCMSTVMDDISLEATSFRQLQQVMEKLDVRTKLCIRDSLYRLARSAEQRHNCTNQLGVRDNGDATGDLIVEDTNKCTGFMDIETDTNPMDRSIAHLLFHRPPDPSRAPSNDSLPLRSLEMLHESVSSPKVKSEQQVFHEEMLVCGETETLITGDG